MEGKSFVDKRRYIRFDSEIKISFQIKDKTKEQNPSRAVSAITKNLSTEGICFVSDRKLEPGSVLELEILLPSHPQPLHLEGRVVWLCPLQQQEAKEIFDVGVKLFTLEKADENRFVGYICDKMTQHLSRYLHL